MEFHGFSSDDFLMILPTIETEPMFFPYIIPNYTEKIPIYVQLLPTFNFSNLNIIEEEKSNQDSPSLLAEEEFRIWPYASTNEEDEIETRNKRKEQKKGRNVISNIFRSYLKYLGSKEFLEEVFPKLRKQVSKEEFSSKLKKELSKFQNYIKKKQIVEFLIKTTQNGEENEFQRILRTSLTLYMKNVHVTTIYNSRKIHLNFRELHFKEMHFFERSIRRLYNEARCSSTSLKAKSLKFYI